MVVSVPTAVTVGLGTVIAYGPRLTVTCDPSPVRSSLRDCERAVRLTPGHMKAILRGVHCCTKLGRSAEALVWCDRGLVIDPTHAELVRLHHAATAQQVGHAGSYRVTGSGQLAWTVNGSVPGLLPRLRTPLYWFIVEKCDYG